MKNRRFSIAYVLCVFLSLFLTVCGGSGGGSTSTTTTGTTTTSSTSTPFQGSWEFIAVSTVFPPPSSSVRLIESNLVQSGGQVNSTQVVEFYYNATGWTPPVQLCGGDGCPIGSTSFTGTATGTSLSFNLTLNDCDDTPCGFQGQGTLTNGIISGTWTSQGASGYTDAGTFTAIAASTLSGVYTGTLKTCLAPTTAGCNGFGSDTASVTFNPNSTTLTATLSGTDNGTFTSSPAEAENIFIGNAFSYPTPIPPGASWYGYYDQTGRYTGVKNSVEVFAGNAGPSSGMYMGLLQGN